MSDNKATKVSHKREITNKRKELEQAIATIADVNLHWGLSKRALSFTYKNEKYTPAKVGYCYTNALEVLTELEELIAPDRPNSVTTKTKAIAKEFVNFVSDPNAFFGELIIDGEVKPVAPLLLSLRKGRTCHRVVNTTLMHYTSVNGLNNSVAKAAGVKSAPTTRSNTDELMRKYIGKYIDQAGKEKGFDSQTGFPAFNANTIASELFSGEEVTPSKEELATYREKLDELKGDNDQCPLSAYTEAIAAFASPSEALIDYANVLHDVAVLGLSKVYTSDKKKTAAPAKAVKGGRGKKTSANTTTIETDPPQEIVDDEPPQETESSVKDESVPAVKPTLKPSTKSSATAARGTPAPVKPAGIPAKASVTPAKPPAAPRNVRK